ncbi:MAG: hypothetical protein ABSD03_15915 [Vulcanimicrobiaceae bacterium]|jgi:hypothetical protein
MTDGLAQLSQLLGSEIARRAGADLWRLVYTRGHLDLDVPRPLVDRSYAGILVYSRSIDDVRSLLVVDAGDRLVAAVGRFGAIPRVASAVRIVGAYDGEAIWKLIVDEPFRLDVHVRFDQQPVQRADRHWVESLRNGVALIRAAEAERRDRLAAERRGLPMLEIHTTGETLMRERADALRREAERRSAFTGVERLQLEAARTSRSSANPAERRRGVARENDLVRARQARFDVALAERLAVLRNVVPTVRGEVNRVAARNRATHDVLARIESSYADSLARSASAFAAIPWLAALDDALFVVEGLDAPPPRLDEPSNANDLLRAIALLVRALPRTRTSIAV